MTVQEFNEKYKEYLEPKFYGLAIDDHDVINYLDELFETKLTKLESFRYYQIKLKFGYCSCYLSKDYREHVDIIQDKINKILKNK